MANTELQVFIDAAKQHGAGDEFLAALLTRRGWPGGEVYQALGEWWERTTGVTVPGRRGAAENARDAFLYLLAFSMLATWAGALGSLWFALIEYWLPDAVTGRYVYNFRSTVTWQMAAILVALPVYLWVMRLIVGETGTNPERLESGVRKWLTYIALLVTAAAVVSDLVVFVDYFLRGEITARFVLKCAVVLAICGGIFWYYLGFLRGGVRSGRFALVALAGASAAFCFGLGVTGTPAVQRQIEADGVRVQDLRTIAGAVSGMKSLPGSLAESSAARPGLRWRDPVTKAPYEYRVKSATEYELCATFAAADDPQSRQYAGDFWVHAKGRSCFALESGRPVPW